MQVNGQEIMEVQCFCYLVQPIIFSISYNYLQKKKKKLGLIITCYVTGVDLKPEQKREMIRYLLNMQKPDGGWGMYVSLKYYIIHLNTHIL